MQFFTGLHSPTTRPNFTSNPNLSGRGPSILLRKTVRSLKSPTGAFIALLRFAAQTRTTLFLLCTKSCIVWRKIGVWRSFYWKSAKRKKTETSRNIKKFQALFCSNWKFTGRWASSWGQVKEGSQMALFPFISLSMRLPFSCSRTSPYATLHNLPAIWCKSGVVVGVVDFRPKCPVCRSDLQRNGLWLPWWLPHKSPSWC